MKCVQQISFLMDELSETEEQYQRNLRAHTEAIDKLLITYKERIEREERNYYGRILKQTLDQTDVEMNKLYSQQNQDEILLQSVTRGVEREIEESLNNVKGIVLSKIDALVKDNKNIRRISATQLENQLQSTWQILQQVLSDYQNKTKNRRKHYDALKEKDDKDQLIIAQQLLRTTNLFEKIQKFENKIIMFDATSKKEISDILTEHEFLQNVCWTVKNRFISEQVKDKDQLKTLSIEYNKTMKHLERLVTKGKSLLALMQICRKYETQDEKVIPFVGCKELKHPITPSSEISGLSDWNVARQITKDFQDLTNFWRRFSFAQIMTDEMRSERNKLKFEANYLRKCLNSYIMQKTERTNEK
ncbi:coiled-coil domain-containing protein 65-like isoform X2 [Pseudomyrmex gracilis]|uniref:coiled-coil domain-containing protein 65-like isoform X2 n=1 Tax=Pseudomyrmex gracilis TaxID=219809 RepID=UPI000994CB0F|nr:coiled-coil domain-containing protein 65-like isoform X2 [Pseudomyrmex gracilis]